METIKDIEKKELVKDIESLMAELDKEWKNAMKEVETRFYSNAEYGKSIDKMGSANFQIGFMRSLAERIEDMDVKRAVLLIRFHSHSLKEPGKSDGFTAGACKELSVKLEVIADKADERRKMEISGKDTAMAV